MRHRRAVHDARGLEVAVCAQPEEKDDQADPRQAGPIKEDAGPKNVLPPGPAAVLKAILAQRRHRSLVFRRRHEQSPARAVLRKLDRAFDPLAGKDQAPIHRLIAAADRDAGDRRFHWI